MASTKPRVSPDFVGRMPKVFLDRLPPRAALLTKRPSAPKALDAIASEVNFLIVVDNTAEPATAERLDAALRRVQELIRG